MKITESPREAFQTLKTDVSSEKKAEYINTLLKAGFDDVEVLSFVSPHIIPQMSDTGAVMGLIEPDDRTVISVLAGSSKYALQASEYDIINQIKYPFAISEKFQKKNLNVNFNKALREIDEIINICVKTGKQPVISLATAFGNPYEEDWGIDILMDRIEELSDKGLSYIPLADTTASADAHLIGTVFYNVIEEFPEIEFNFHMHSKPEEAIEKIEGAIDGGCTNFDTVLKGRGGCPMTGSEPVANLDTFTFLEFLDTNNIDHNIDIEILKKAALFAEEIF